MQRWGYPEVPWPGRENCTAREVAGNTSMLSKPSLSSLPPAKQQSISRPRPLSLISGQPDSHWLPRSPYSISHRACAQPHGVTPYPAGTDQSEKVRDSHLCFLGAAQPSPAAKGPPHRIYANKGLHSFLYLLSQPKESMQQSLGHKLSLKCRIFLSVGAVFSITTFVATNQKIHGFRLHTFTSTFKTLPLQADWKEFREGFVLMLPPVILQDTEQVEAALAKAELRRGSS